MCVTRLQTHMYLEQGTDPIRSICCQFVSPVHAVNPLLCRLLAACIPFNLAVGGRVSQRCGQVAGLKLKGFPDNG